MILDNAKKMTAACRGRMSALLVGIRIRNRQIEILVHVKVAKVWIHSPKVYFLNSMICHGVR